jgi:PAS domain S-box-containing protein
MTIGSPYLQRWGKNAFRIATEGFRQITEPSAKVAPAQRRRIRLLSAFFLIISLNTLLSSFILKNTGNEAWKALAATSIVLIIGYGVSRTRHDRVALAMAIAIPAIPPLAIAIFHHPEISITVELMWLAMPLMVSSLMMTVRKTVCVALFYLAFLIALKLFGLIGLETLTLVMAFLLIIAFFTIVITYIRRKDQAELKTQLSERARAEETLRESEEKFYKAFQASPESISINKLEDGEFIEVNDSFLKSNGFTREEIIGRKASEVPLWASEADRERMTRLLKEQGHIDNEEFRFKVKSGEIRTVLLSADKISIGGEPCTIVVSTDITEHKLAEKALADEATRRRILIEQSRDGIVVLDQNGKVYEANRRFAEMLGYSPEEVMKLDVWDWEYLYPPEQVKEMIRTVTEDGDHFETRHRRKDGTIYDVEISTNGATFADQKLIFCVCRDITERKRAEAELKQALANLEQSSTLLAATNKELESFSYSVSHDLRSPLRSIDGFSQALLEDYQDNLDKTGQNYLRRLRGASQKMGELIDGLLKLSRLTRSEMHLKTVDLSALAEEIAARLQETQPERRVKFVIDKGLTANGDPELLRALLENLLSNAWKFTGKNPEAKIEFSLDRNGDKKAFFIRDNGAGFDMAYADKLFSAFQRLHGTEEFPGTGIGLATVQRIINRHGGTIRAEGAVGKGATFHFTLN